MAILYSILVDLSPTFYCLPKPLFLYGSIVLLSTLLVLSSYSVTMIMLGYESWLCMVINISVQYNGGFLPDIILLTQGYYHYWGNSLTRIQCSIDSLRNIILLLPCLMVYYIVPILFLLASGVPA